MESFEQFRKNCGLERFILAGHSFGGYIGGCYCIKYPQHIEKILFLSAVGISTTPPDYDFVKELKGNWALRWFQKFIMFMWVHNNITPSVVMRTLGPISHKFFREMIIIRPGSLNNEEEGAMRQYLEQINLLPGSGDYAVANILDFGHKAYCS